MRPRASAARARAITRAVARRRDIHRGGASLTHRPRRDPAAGDPRHRQRRPRSGPPGLPRRDADIGSPAIGGNVRHEQGGTTAGLERGEHSQDELDEETHEPHDDEPDPGAQRNLAELLAVGLGALVQQANGVLGEVPHEKPATSMARTLTLYCVRWLRRTVARCGRPMLASMPRAGRAYRDGKRAAPGVRARAPASRARSRAAAISIAAARPRISKDHAC